MEESNESPSQVFPRARQLVRVIGRLAVPGARASRPHSKGGAGGTPALLAPNRAPTVGRREVFGEWGDAMVAVWTRQMRVILALSLMATFLGVGATGVAHGQDAASKRDDQPRTVLLWPKGTPGAKGVDPDKDVPSMKIWLPKPELATGAAVVVCPGGGYAGLADDHEGKQVAEWLNSLGIAAFVLKYRLGPRYHHPAMLQDAARAIRMVRADAFHTGVDPHRIAIIGFSAGGHLASTAGTHFDAGKPDSDDPIERVSSRPDRVILIYPVIALATPYGHTGSLRNLLGENPPRELVESLSNERQVTKDTPPTFLAHTNADKPVPAENSLLFALALRKAGVPVELHLFEHGPHGLGLGNGSSRHSIAANPAFQAWPKLCETWLKNQGFLDRKKG